MALLLPKPRSKLPSALAGSPLAALGVRLGPRRSRPRRRINRRSRNRPCHRLRRARCHVGRRLAPGLRLDGVSARLGGSGGSGVVRRSERGRGCTSVRLGARPRSLRFCHSRRTRRSLRSSSRARSISAGIPRRCPCRRQHHPCPSLTRHRRRFRGGLQPCERVRRQLRPARLRGRLAPGARRLRQLSARAVLRRRRRARQLSHQRRLHAS